ncbi:hypothetical protein GCM10010517_72980 [Streptosporangium fragile]|uniref:Uncharacterized protein n=1 Tax=Streptosporangium fragile TaxID=46186 RepID=A0ABP6IRM2_9ACTN
MSAAEGFEGSKPQAPSRAVAALIDGTANSAMTSKRFEERRLLTYRSPGFRGPMFRRFGNPPVP